MLANDKKKWSTIRIYSGVLSIDNATRMMALLQTLLRLKCLKRVTDKKRFCCCSNNNTVRRNWLIACVVKILLDSHYRTQRRIKGVHYMFFLEVSLLFEVQSKKKTDKTSKFLREMCGY